MGTRNLKLLPLQEVVVQESDINNVALVIQITIEAHTIVTEVPDDMRGIIIIHNSPLDEVMVI